mmetsp:Transcript_30308/g.93516  ORF Transcript_30308/g.93516 Transcript_30308/m.93516 type:complete len:228 (-) Transcript_30308:937-1620(-)
MRACIHTRAFQSRTYASAPIESTCERAWLYETPKTTPSCACTRHTSWSRSAVGSSACEAAPPLAAFAEARAASTSHTRHVESRPHDSSRRPSPQNSTQCTGDLPWEPMVVTGASVLRVSHSKILLSIPDVAMSDSSKLMSAAHKVAVCPRNVATGVSWRKSNTKARLSSPPETHMCGVNGLHFTVNADAVCAWKVWMHLPRATSQTLFVVSIEDVKIHLESHVKSTP